VAPLDHAQSRVRKSLEDMRQAPGTLRVAKVGEGLAFTPDGTAGEFEDAFEFEETNDQKRCTRTFKRDMERETPMDRLLCGDVVYG